VVVGSFTNALGCTSNITYSVLAYPSPKADFSYSPNKPIENLDDVVFAILQAAATSINGAGILSTTMVYKFPEKNGLSFRKFGNLPCCYDCYQYLGLLRYNN